MNVNYVSVQLLSLEWNSLLVPFIEKIKDKLDLKKCGEELEGKLFDREPHITLHWSDSVETVGHNVLYFLLTSKNHELYQDLKNNSEIHLDNPVIDYFELDEGYVLKINVEQSCSSDLNLVLQDYRDLLNHLGFLNKRFPNYHPHITITYLKEKLTEDELQELIELLRGLYLVINKLHFGDEDSNSIEYDL